MKHARRAEGLLLNEPKLSLIPPVELNLDNTREYQNKTLLSLNTGHI
jgi:hypothetical protein